MSSDNDQSVNEQRAAIEYVAGQEAFERGQYQQAIRHLETATGLANRNAPAGGDMQLWLVTAYEAAGQQDRAIDLCQSLIQHPNFQTRKQSQRLLYILKAPKLKTNPEWLTQIPDLGEIGSGDGVEPSQSKYGVAPSVKASEKEEDLLDLTPLGTQDNRFVWFALGAAAVVLGGLIWLS